MIIVSAVSLVVLGAGSVWVLYGSEWLRVRYVSVSGTRVLTPAEVRDAADVPTGVPLASVGTDAVEARLRGSCGASTRSRSPGPGRTASP